MTDPIPIYRFLDSHAALETLKAGKFRVGLVSKFNDLFEWKLGFAGKQTPEEEKLAENFNDILLPYLETWGGVLSFSDSISTPVLWSIYAEKHRGIAFEVKFRWPVDTLQKITYFPERPVLDFDQLRGIVDQTKRDQYFLKLINGLMRNKSPGFAFEQEYRLQINLNDLNHCQRSDGNYDWQLPDKSLNRVILGFCCPLDDTVVRKLLDKNGFTETEVVRAKMCRETYSIIV